MKLNRLPILALAGFLGAATTTPVMVYAQQNTTAGEQAQESGSSAKGALHETGNSVKHLYHAAKAEVGDAALTTKVKTALLENKATKPYTIHVSSDQGAVTLKGEVDSPEAAAAAKRVAGNVSGVRTVNNELTWHTSAR
jgi:hyperosmotically inducible protein